MSFRTMNRLCRPACLVLFLTSINSIVFPSLAESAPIYSVVDLGQAGTYGPNDGAGPFALNDLGQVLGNTPTAGGSGINQYIYSGGNVTNYGTGVSFLYTNASGQIIERINNPDPINPILQGYLLRQADGSSHAIAGLTTNDTPVGIDNAGMCSSRRLPYPIPQGHRFRF